jgi:hypothetical protein
VDDEELRFLIELRDTTQRTLRMLRLQKAQFGVGAPPHIDLGIRQATKEIAVLEAKLNTVQISQTVIDAIGPQDAGALLIEYRLKQIDAKVNDALAQIGDRIREFADVADQRHEQEQKVRTQRQEEHDARMTIIEQGIETNATQVLLLSNRVWWVRIILIAALLIGLGIGVAFATGIV